MDDEDTHFGADNEFAIDLEATDLAIQSAPLSISSEATSTRKLLKIKENVRVDSLYGFEEFTSAGESRVGWLFNMQMTEVLNKEDHRFMAALNLYFIANDSNRFKVVQLVRPYFYVIPRDEFSREIMTRLARKYADKLSSISLVEKDDLSLNNHLTGLRRSCIRLCFFNNDDMNAARRELMPFALKSRSINHRHQVRTASFISGDTSTAMSSTENSSSLKMSGEPLEYVIDIREYDVPFVTRAAIDLNLCTGLWYEVSRVTTDLSSEKSYIISPQPLLLQQPDPGVFAFDIETTKSPLKFPDASIDQIMMISYMYDGLGFLVNNREIIGEDVSDFEYTPKKEFPGHFKVINLPDEKSVLHYFFDHIGRVRPLIFVTYNGDSFDWPFIETRALQHGIDLTVETGFAKSSKQGQVQDYLCRPAVHMDCLKWVKRDSYLPIGSQGLKAVTKAKLRYDPVEVDPELMCKYAAEHPQLLCTYSVSDAVATFYLYTKYVHPFIFALCTIIPLGPDDVLRNGSSTLCEGLLMAEAFKANVIFPNRQTSPVDRYTNDGHLIEQETYVGASVEALESGVFRSDIPIKFKTSPVAIQDLIQKVDRTLELAIETEGVDLSNVTNLKEVSEEIIEKLSILRDNPFVKELPFIYHLHVGAMYPNIILTNRLQPSAIVTRMDCATCSFNAPNARCKRSMEWVSRTEYMPVTRVEVQRVKAQLESERFPVSANQPLRSYFALPVQQRSSLEKKRLADYSKKVYKRIHFVREEKKETVICQRENSFYVDTVRAFRDRRYEFKSLHKKWKSELEHSKDSDHARYCSNMVVLYDSLQMAHKCILNSFYGYVMRKGARWHSLEMAGIVCYTGSLIITKARILVDQIGMPLELDTDGIWCMLPSSFPSNFVVKTINDMGESGSFKVSYPCAILNLLVKGVKRRGRNKSIQNLDFFKPSYNSSHYVPIKDYFTNDQYHELVLDDDTDGLERRRIQYVIKSENSIFFEVDGPYHAMILPASKEEGKRIKKRYCVFNFDRTIAELKGFEVKRNGELELIKIFQSSVFEAFLNGQTLDQSYHSAAKVANYWLDILHAKGRGLSDDELFELIAENRRMSRQLSDYGSQKSTSISTAKRLAEFLGEQMIKDKGLTCRFIISRRPEGAPIADRAIPVAIFQAEPAIKRHFLRKWLKLPDLGNFDIRNHIDWDYYIDRFNGCLQKLITIPASFQNISNPLPRVPYPDWLQKRLMEKFSTSKQQRLEDFFNVEKKEVPTVATVPKVNRTPNEVTAKAIEQNSNPAQTRPVHRIRLNHSRQSFLEYIRFYKQMWRQLVQEPCRSRTKKPGLKNKKKADTVQANDIRYFIRESQITDTLQILEIFPLSRGFARIITMNEDGHYFSYTVRLNRKFYVNRKTKMDEEVDYCKLTQKILPRGARTQYLYEYIVPEKFFIENYHEITVELCNSGDVLGIYELQTSPILRFIIETGTMCTMDTNRNGPLTLDQIIREDPVESRLTYLAEDVLPETVYIYFYRKRFRSRKRVREIAFASVVLISRKIARVFVLNHRGENRLPNLRKIFLAERRKRTQNAAVDESLYPPEDHTFQVRVVQQAEELYSLLNTTIMDFVNSSVEENGNLRIAHMIVTHSSALSDELRQLIPCLNDSPIVRLTFNDNARLKGDEWQDSLKNFKRLTVISRHFVSSYLSANFSLSYKIEQSRYYQIPLGNIEDDAISFACDVFYARNLQSTGHVLWWSTNTDVTSTSPMVYNHIPVSPTAVCEAMVNQPSVYTSACVQFELINLAACALLGISRLNEIDGVIDQNAAGVSNDVGLTGVPNLGPSASGAFSDTFMMSCSSLRILKNTVSAWMNDAMHFKNQMADTLLTHFLRWLINPTSHMYESCLASSVILSMKKMLSLLLNEIESLGGVVVYADVWKVIVNFKKHGAYGPLINYAQYITKVALQLGDDVEEKVQVFAYARLRPLKCWHALLWVDPFNYCGLMNTEPLNLNEKRVEAKFFLLRHLHSDLRKQVTNLIGSYVVFIAEQFALRELGEVTKIDKSVQIVNASVFPDMETDEVGSKILSNIRNIINIEMNGNAVMLSKWAERSIDTSHIPRDVYPRFMHSYFAWDNPSLECIRCLCAILSVDQLSSDLIFNLEHDLLKHLGYGHLISSRDSSKGVANVGFNTSLVVPQVYSCLSVLNVDLFRDCAFNLIENGGAITEEDDGRKDFWLCLRCHRPYDVNFIEQFLIDVVDNLLVQYFSQDHQCPKCREVRMSNFEKYCKCSGMNYEKTLFPTRLIDRLRPIYWISVLARMTELVAHITGLSVFSNTVAKNLISSL
ncbi:hypothetical protein ACOME3_007367 [Neoechinorhynchus agilis]